jgi:magnesium-transporting ATPase (P-type)
MITGDKQETAINIAIACKLVHHHDSLIIINAAESNEAARARLEEALQQCRAQRGTAANGADGKGVPALVSVLARLSVT